MKRTFCVLTLTFCFLYQYGQIVDFHKIVPPAPESAHLQKEVKIPVDYSTGIPNISIPLFNLATGSISIPISLSYHASGIKVGQLSSSVGLGWGLNAGGGVTRSIRGKADDAGWLLNNYTSHFATVTMDGTKAANDFMLSDYDFGQDDYSYNFLGYGGSFFFDSTKTIRNVEKDQVSLEYIWPGSHTKFKAKDMSGFTYYFDSTDNSFSTSYPSNNPSNTALTGGISAWKLTKIKYQGVDSAVLDYEKYTIDYEEKGADVWDERGIFNNYVPTVPGNVTCGDDYSTTLYYMRLEHNFDNSLVKKITSRDTRIDFYYSTDSAATIWKRRLDSIIVKSLVDSSIKKKIFLSYSLFSGNGQLKLTAVKEMDLNTGHFEETRFQYYENISVDLPDIDSRSKDMFGYFNNKANDYLIVTGDADYTNVFTNADRTVNADAIMLGTLRSITHSLGGYSEFVYEPNKIDSSTYGPGLRVKEVNEYNGFDGKLNKTDYSYFNYHGQSVFYPYSMSPAIQTASYTRKYFSSDEPNNYHIPIGVEPMGYLYDSVVIKAKGSKADLLTTYKYNFFIIYNGYKSFPIEIDYYSYDTSAHTYSLIKKDSSSYIQTINYDHQTPLLGIQRPTLLLVNAWIDGDYTCAQATSGFYTGYTYVENTLLKAKGLSVTYSNGNSITEETRYYYANMDHIQPTRIVKLNSIDSTITTIKYPAEMVSNSLDPTGVYQSMLDDHYWIPPIITETLDAGSNSLNKTVTGYKQWTGMIAPELAQSGTKGATPETRKKINQYDAYGNISEYEVDGMKNCFIWDYNSSLPVASASNAAISETAYSGFETNYSGGWTLHGGSYIINKSITGKRSYSLSSGDTITKSSLPIQDYIVSYWSRTGPLTIHGFNGVAGMTKNGWTYYEHLVTASSSVSLSGTDTLDDLRLYPAKAQMATYAYDPLRGMTGSSDVSNRINYYEYDGMGRLYLVRDIDRNIVKRINYSLTQSGTSGIYYNTEFANTFTRSNCGSGYDGNEIEYIIPAGRYSSMISQTDADNQAALEMNRLGQQYADEYGKCTIACTSCPAPMKHCDNGVCLKGVKVYTSSVYNAETGKYDCVYHYEFSDGFSSIWIMEESDTPCL